MNEIEAIVVLDSIRFIYLPQERRAEMCDALKIAMQALREKQERESGRAQPENEPLINAEVCIDLVEEACRRGHYYDIDTIIEDYRHKPERSEV